MGKGVHQGYLVSIIVIAIAQVTRLHFHFDSVDTGGHLIISLEELISDLNKP